MNKLNRLTKLTIAACVAALALSDCAEQVRLGGVKNYDPADSESVDDMLQCVSIFDDTRTDIKIDCGTRGTITLTHEAPFEPGHHYDQAIYNTKHTDTGKSGIGARTIELITLTHDGVYSVFHNYGGLGRVTLVSVEDDKIIQDTCQPLPENVVVAPR